MVSLGAGRPGVEEWYVFGKDKYKFELGGGCTGVMAPGLYPLLRSGQINGLIGGLRGAAEYESLIDQKGKAVAGMDAQSATHLAIIVLVIMCNLFYFSLRHGREGNVLVNAMPFESIVGAWVATGLTLLIFSFLYKDNPLFKLAEHLYVGVSVGYVIVKTYDTVIVHLIVKPIFETGRDRPVDSRRYRPAHADALRAESRLAVSLCLRLHRGGRIGVSHSTHDFIVHFEAS
jgi:hypothetical protein